MVDRKASLMQRRSALDGLVFPGDAAFSITPVRPATRFILRGEAGVVDAFGAGRPAPLSASTGANGHRAAFWLGPDEFLLIAPDDEAAEIGAALRASLATVPHSLVDVSHRQIGLTLDGPRAPRILTAGCPLDLRLAAFPVGRVARTLLAKAEIVLWRQAEHRFHLEVWRSFAPYVVGYLMEAARGAPER